MGFTLASPLRQSTGPAIDTPDDIFWQASGVATAAVRGRPRVGWPTRPHVVYDDVVARQKTVETSARVAVRGGGRLRLAVVADTHSALHPSAAKHIGLLSPAAILHAGDIGELSVLDELEAIAPLFAVRGNIDVRARDLPDLLTLDVVAGDVSVLRILLMHIAVNGPRLRADAARLARSRDAALVVCGHSHVPLVARDGELSVFNPGSAGPRRFLLPIVFGTIDVTPTAVRLAHYECETGRPWTPR